MGLFPFPYRAQVRDRSGNDLGDPISLYLWPSNSSPGAQGQEYVWQAVLQGSVAELIGKRNRVLIVTSGPHASEYRVVSARYHDALAYTQAELRQVKADG